MSTWRRLSLGIDKASELTQTSAGNKDVLLGRGESLLSGIDFISLGYELTIHKTTPKTMHLIIICFLYF